MSTAPPPAPRLAAPASARVRGYELLLRVRPSQLAALIKSLLRIGRTPVRGATGQAFLVDPVSVFGLRLLREQQYEPGMTRLLQLLLGPAHTFVDVGGNEGYFSIVAASLCGSRNVHCVEPQGRLQPVIEANLRLNGVADRVRVHRVAIAEGSDEVELFLRPSTNTGASSLYRHWRFGKRTERVPAMTLDAFFARERLDRVRLVKIDCEGAERTVIAGAREVLRRQAVEYLALEYHPTICGDAACEEVHAELTAAGYVLTCVGEHGIYHLPGSEAALRPLGELTVGAPLGAALEAARRTLRPGYSPAPA